MRLICVIKEQRVKINDHKKTIRNSKKITRKESLCHLFPPLGWIVLASSDTEREITGYDCLIEDSARGTGLFEAQVHGALVEHATVCGVPVVTISSVPTEVVGISTYKIASSTIYTQVLYIDSHFNHLK